MSSYVPPSAMIAVTSYLDVRMERWPTRRLCPDCHHKRVLVAVATYQLSWRGLGSELAGKSIYRCLDCWGIRS